MQAIPAARARIKGIPDVTRSTDNPTRRDALKAIAAGTTAATLAAGSAIALAADDPAIAAIDRHRHAFAAYLATFDPVAEAEARAFALPQGSAERKAADAVSETRFLDQCRFARVADVLAFELADTRPTTLAGCVAVLRYVTAHNDAAHLFPDQLDGADEPGAGYGLDNGSHRALWDHRLRVSLAEALATIAGKGALS